MERDLGADVETVVDGDGTPDGAADAGSDAGIALLQCNGVFAWPIPSAGIAESETTGRPDDFRGDCGGDGAPDVLFGFTSPGALESLSVSLEGSDYDTALYLYLEGCSPAQEIACNDDYFGVQSFIEVTNQPAGDYFVVVDGFGGEAGSFVLTAEGVIAAGERCDPILDFLACSTGTACAASGPAFRCIP